MVNKEFEIIQKDANVFLIKYQNKNIYIKSFYCLNPDYYKLPKIIKDASTSKNIEISDQIIEEMSEIIAIKWAKYQEIVKSSKIKIDEYSYYGSPLIDEHIDIYNRHWIQISQYSRHQDHPDNGFYGHPNSYWVCPLCTFHLFTRSIKDLDEHKCKDIMLLPTQGEIKDDVICYYDNRFHKCYPASEWEYYSEEYPLVKWYKPLCPAKVNK